MNQERPPQQTPYDVSYNSTHSSNSQFNSATALQVRLNVQPLIEDIELFLRGARIELYMDSKTGKTKSRYVPLGKGSAKANPSGIQGILSMLISIINNSVVQGNYDNWRYENAICDIRKDLSTNIMNNLYNWDVKEDDFDVIVDTIMNLVEPFLSRLLDNKERDSYTNTIRTNEVNTLREQARSMLPFGALGGRNAG
ncbi:hypothetical protein GF386_05330 [Candidatus Pacearchaeota archaeon]|nr:hypothetical protein [Candidatus Pacearchaeota archaeon]